MTKIIFSIMEEKCAYSSFSQCLNFWPGNVVHIASALPYLSINEYIILGYLQSSWIEKIKKYSISLVFLLSFLIIGYSGSAQLGPGDAAVVGVNIENDSIYNDQISIVIFDTVTTGMSIEITDNGWQQTNPNRWGNQEGVVSFTLTGADINPGFVLTLKGTGSQKSDFRILPDSNNWSVDTVIGSFDLTIDDQIWILQGGTWDNGSTTDNAIYDGGSVITGWSAPQWTNNNPGSLTSSDVYPNMNCIVFSAETTAKKQKMKYNGPHHEASKRVWIDRINDFNNWTQKNTTSAYLSSTPKYVEGDTLKVSSDSITDGIWYGDKNHNWYDCANWSDLTVPDSKSHVYLNNDAQGYLEIDSNAEYSDLFNDSAKCKNITINKDSVILVDSPDQLDIYGNLLIDGGKLIANSGHISIRGDWQNIDTLGFSRGNGVVKFYGSGQQTITNNQTREYFNQLEIQKPQGTITKLKAHVTTQMLKIISGHVLLDTSNLIVNDSLEGGDQQNYIITKNDHAFGGYLFLEPNDTETAFPIGTNSNYTPVYIANSGTEVFKARTFDGIFENGYSGNSLTGDIVNRTWAIELVNADSATADIKLQWNAPLEVNQFSSSRAKGVMIFNSGTGTGNEWTDWSMLLLKSQPPAGSNPYTIQSFDLNQFGLFGISNRCQLIEINTSKIYHY
ncbi:MAG: hypothetical protein ACQESZ_01165 [Bacteroidota bacterium]